MQFSFAGSVIHIVVGIPEGVGFVVRVILAELAEGMAVPVERDRGRNGIIERLAHVSVSVDRLHGDYRVVLTIGVNSGDHQLRVVFGREPLDIAGKRKFAGRVFADCNFGVGAVVPKPGFKNGETMLHQAAGNLVRSDAAKAVGLLQVVGVDKASQEDFAGRMEKPFRTLLRMPG